MEKSTEKELSIGNYYGNLIIQKNINGKYYWGMKNYDGVDWSEITEELYKALDKFRAEEES